ncbi:Uma2 family endonuclease [Nonomuraea lactucae]|uniref:Uma2 family endonuclease n=1 Tax=Nonomuraea lactucae TaxID=2249762 RepID=UPI000DE387CD|nr:Uma2 family endonuclease [Nonomuraea lactucae]
MIEKQRECARLEFTGEGHLPETARDLFDALPELPGFRAEVIQGDLIVSPLGTPEHSWIAADLHDALLPLRQQHGWRGSVGGVSICIEGSREPAAPDYVLSPADCPRWGNLELLSSGVILVAEVVSPSSVRRDHEDKPFIYAQGSVPIYLLIDPVDKRPTVTVFSNVDDGAYRTVHTAPLGAPLLLPKPIDLELDTSVFKG